MPRAQCPSSLRQPSTSRCRVLIPGVEEVRRVPSTRRRRPATDRCRPVGEPIDQGDRGQGDGISRRTAATLEVRDVALVVRAVEAHAVPAARERDVQPQAAPASAGQAGAPTGGGADVRAAVPEGDARAAAPLWRRRLRRSSGTRAGTRPAAHRPPAVVDRRPERRDVRADVERRHPVSGRVRGR